MSHRIVMREIDSQWDDFWAYLKAQGEGLSAAMMQGIRTLVTSLRGKCPTAEPPVSLLTDVVSLCWDKGDEHIDLEFDRSGLVRFFYFQHKTQECISRENLSPEELTQEICLPFWKRMYR